MKKAARGGELTVETLQKLDPTINPLRLIFISKGAIALLEQFIKDYQDEYSRWKTAGELITIPQIEEIYGCTEKSLKDIKESLQELKDIRGLLFLRADGAAYRYIKESNNKPKRPKSGKPPWFGKLA